MVKKVDLPPDSGNSPAPKPAVEKKKLTGVIIVGAIIVVAILAAL